MYWKTIWIPQILGAVFGGVFVFHLGRSKTPEILLHTMEEFTGMIRESKGYTGWAEKTERKLIRNGAKYHFGKTITPMKYLTGRIVLAFLGAISLLKIGCGYAVLAATVLYFLPELLLIYMNERDNRNMLTEIKLIYQALEVQIRAGIYVADALTECCQSVKGRRLQQALIELAGDLVMQSDLMMALSAFQGKFDNRQIDALCITLIQAGESGQAVDPGRYGRTAEGYGDNSPKSSEKCTGPQHYILPVGDAGCDFGSDLVCLCGIYVPCGSEILNSRPMKKQKYKI